MASISIDVGSEGLTCEIESQPKNTPTDTVLLLTASTTWESSGRRFSHDSLFIHGTPANLRRALAFLVEQMGGTVTFEPSDAATIQVKAATEHESRHEMTRMPGESNESFMGGGL